MSKVLHVIFNIQQRIKIYKGEKKDQPWASYQSKLKKKLTILFAPFNIYIYFLCGSLARSRSLFSHRHLRRCRRRQFGVFLPFNFATIFYANEIHHKISWICICVCICFCCSAAVIFLVELHLFRALMWGKHYARFSFLFALKHTINFHEIIFDKFVYTTNKW